MKKILNIGIFLLILTISGAVYGQYGDHNRPSPLMDYVPQEIGFYDTCYEELSEKDCRRCHGSSLADRHHATALVTRDGLCTSCHAVDGSSGITIVRDCVTAGCHKTVYDRVSNGWHHNTDLAAVGNCTACHDPNLVGRISPVEDFVASPPSIVTPTPFSCENCHWEQDVSPPESPSLLGHPSTYDHYDRGRFVGAYQYTKPIYGSFDTHHMGFEGSLVKDCYMCHSVNPNAPSWSSSDPELIRYCEACHTPETLHGIAPHVEGSPGWMAVGFHAEGEGSGILNPVAYRTSKGNVPAGVSKAPQFTANEMCVACHGDAVLPFLPSPATAPVLDEIFPSHGVCGGIVRLRGANLGLEHSEGYDVELKTNADEWIQLDIYSWTSTEINFQMPCWDLATGNYKVRVRTPSGESNQVNFTLDSVSVSGLSSDKGVCGDWIQLYGSGLGTSQSEMVDGYFGIYRIVDFVSSRRVLSAVEYRRWNGGGEVAVRFGPLFEDHISPSTGTRNFLWDDADGPLIQDCGEVGEDTYSVYLKTVYFGDDDASGGFSGGDTIFQVVPSNPHYFKSMTHPVLNSTDPSLIPNSGLLHIYGFDFGVNQGDSEVRIGTENQGSSDQLGKGLVLADVVQWSDTRIVVRVEVPAWAEGGEWAVWVEKEIVKSNYEMLKVESDSPSFALNIMKEGSGGFSPLSGEIYADGDTVTLRAFPEEGWAFDYWLIEGERVRTNPFTLTMNCDKEVRVVFVQVTEDSNVDQNSTMPDEEEKLSIPSSEKDRNNDGIVDSNQDNVVSLQTFDGKYFVTIESPPGTVLKDCVAVGRPLGADAPPSNGEYPYGFFSFVVDKVEMGGETKVTIYLPTDAELATYYKYGPEPGHPDPHWYEFVYDDQTRTGAKIDANRITLHFVDGQGGDDDLEVNGRIVDDGGPRAQEKERDEGGGGSGGCFIGTMSGW